jgi:thiamine kinase-like enzyme
VLGDDEQGRSMLSFIPGDVGIPPFERWVADDALLLSVADLQRRLHQASASYEIPDHAVWDRSNLALPQPGDIVCHNDLCVENVVVRDGAAIAVIDFDFAAPNDRLVDIAIAARHWVPFKASADLEPARADVDRFQRFRLFCDAHHLTEHERLAVVDAATAFLDRAMISMKARADAGQALYQKVWEQGYPLQNRRSHAWLRAERDRLCR